MSEIFTGFILLFILFYIIVIMKDPKLLFFTIVTFGIFYYLQTKQKQKGKIMTNNVNQHIEKLEQRLNKDYEIPNTRVYHMHKTPRSLKYIKKTDDIRQVLYRLRFLNIYEPTLYDRLVSFTETFLKVHYKIMLEQYDFDTYYPILKDLRNEILNIMKTIYFNVPNISKILYIRNLDTLVDDLVIQMQAKTYKYIKIVYHKFARSHMTYQAPFEYDNMKDNMYDFY